MFEDLFREGALAMSGTPVPPLESVFGWGDCLVNRITILAAMVILIIDLQDMIDISPDLWDCVRRSRGNVSLEHSVSKSRSRNWAAFFCLIPFCLLADRYRLYPAEWMQSLPLGWSLAAAFGLALFYILFRKVMFLAARPRRIKGETGDAAFRTLYTFFIFATAIMLLTAGILHFFKTGETAIRSVLLWESALAWAFSTLRAGQILRTQCSGLTTFLYLCALEFLPLGLLIAGAVFF